MVYDPCVPTYIIVCRVFHLPPFLFLRVDERPVCIHGCMYL
jgi:hypothetical protein